MKYCKKKYILAKKFEFNHSLFDSVINRDNIKNNYKGLS